MQRSVALIAINVFIITLLLALLSAPNSKVGQAQNEAATATLLPTTTPTPFVAPSVTVGPLLTPRSNFSTPIAQPGDLDEASGLPVPSPAATYQVVREYSMLNILLVGHDSESDGEPGGGYRTDTLIVVNINRTAGTVSMLSLPRDLYVYVPDWRFVRLNTVWDRGLFVYGGNAGGFRLIKETLWYNYALELHYFAMIDFSGFKEIIDTLGGVNIAVDCPIEDYRWTGGYDAEGTPTFDLITIPVGLHQMDSITALMYARSRRNSNDFDRGRRQQQLIRAVFSTARSQGLLADIPSLYNDITSIVETNIPPEVFLQLAPLGLALDPTNIESHFLQTGRHTQGYTAASGAAVQIPTERLFQLINAFLVPPTQNRLVAEGARIGIFDSSGVGMRWDVVAADRLLWEGLNSMPLGEAIPPGDIDISSDSIIIDYTGQAKGNSVDVLARILSISPEDIYNIPNPDRTVDYAVYLSPAYSACYDRQVIE